MTDQSSDATRARLLDAALCVFADNGFHNASVRDICSRAQANTAAVNYHFGDKAQLYQQVFERATSRRLALAQVFDSAEPAEAFTAYYRALLAPLAEGEHALQVARLYAREQLEPTGILTDLRSKYLEPAHARLVTYVCTHIGVAQADITIERLAFSLVGMGAFYLHAQPVVQALRPQVLAGSGWLDDLAAQLALQAVALLKAYRECKQGSAQ